MVDEGGLYLSWKQFETHVRSTWKQLLFEKNFCDVTFACEDGQIPVHKAIVSHSSPVLKDILDQHLSKNPVIYFKGVKYKHLENMMNYIYKGEVTVAKEDFEKFLKISEDLKIRGLFVGNGENEMEMSDQYETLSPPVGKGSEVIEIIEGECTKENSELSENFAVTKVYEEKRDLKEIYWETGKHKGVRYKCNKCDASFTLKPNLRRHITSVHEGVYYECSICDFKASQKIHLKRHIKTHCQIFFQILEIIWEMDL